MLNEDQGIAYYYSLRPIGFHDLIRLEIRQTVSFGAWDTTLEVELRAVDKLDTRRLLLFFAGVRNLKLIPSECSIIHFSSIEVYSIAERGWEDINYKVFESEQDAELSFICREFYAEIHP